ncbi:MAG TPA: VOC family protein [Vicinamibacterales bacterium]|nr:VOC family protein [Vicinamibacterales bacterium]
MKTNMFVVLLVSAALTAGTASAQPAPFNEIGVTMGHWHVISKDVEANKKLFLALGGKLFMPGGNPLIMFPGIYINLVLLNEKGDGGTGGLDHIGFDVKDHAAVVKKIVAQGITLDEPVRNSAAGNTITYITDPWGTRIEIVERAPLGPQVQ